jgi:hypothetical protein
MSIEMVHGPIVRKYISMHWSQFKKDGCQDKDREVMHNANIHEEEETMMRERLYVVPVRHRTFVHAAWMHPTQA